MFDAAYISKDVTAAVVQLLPVFLLAFIVAEGAAMSELNRDARLTKTQRKRTRSAAVFLLVVVFGALVIETMFLLALNTGDIRGGYAVALWLSAIAWLVALVIAVVSSTLPDLERHNTRPRSRKNKNK